MRLLKLIPADDPEDFDPKGVSLLQQCMLSGDTECTWAQVKPPFVLDSEDYPEVLLWARWAGHRLSDVASDKIYVNVCVPKNKTLCGQATLQKDQVRLIAIGFLQQE